MQQMVEHGKYLVSARKRPGADVQAAALSLDRDRNRPRDGTEEGHRVQPAAPLGLYAVAGVILTMLFAYEMLGLEAAVLAGLTLAGAYQYITLGRFGRVDMTLTFFEALSLFSFFWWIGPKPTETPSFGAGNRQRADAVSVLAIALGLAVLAKGPVGALLAARCDGNFRRRRRTACARLFTGSRCSR